MLDRFLISGLLLAVGLLAGCDGAKARLGVASDKAIAKIDSLLGEINVKQRKVEDAYAELETSVEKVREKRIEAQVRLKALDSKKSELNERRAKLTDDLKQLQGMLQEAGDSGSIERNGKQIAVEKVKSTAEELIGEMKMVKDQLQQNQILSTAWAKNLQVLKKQEETSGQQMKKLEDSLAEIRSKKSALDGMKEAASIAGPDTSISDKFNDLTAEVDELLINVDTEFQIEEAKLDERAAAIDSDPMADLDALLEDKTDVSGTLGEIDKLLNEEGGQ